MQEFFAEREMGNGSPALMSCPNGFARGKKHLHPAGLVPGQEPGVIGSEGQPQKGIAEFEIAVERERFPAAGGLPQLNSPAIARGQRSAIGRKCHRGDAPFVAG